MRENEHFTNDPTSAEVPLPASLVPVEIVSESEEILRARHTLVEFDMSYQSIVDQTIAALPEGIYAMSDIRNRVFTRWNIEPRYNGWLIAPIHQNEGVVPLRMDNRKLTKREFYVRPTADFGQADIWSAVDELVARLDRHELTEARPLKDCIKLAGHMGLLPAGMQQQATFKYVLQKHPRLRVRDQAITAILPTTALETPVTVGDAVDKLAATVSSQLGATAYEWETRVFEGRRLTPGAHEAFQIALEGHSSFIRSVKNNLTQYFLGQEAADAEKTRAQEAEVVDSERVKLLSLTQVVMSRIIDDNTVTLMVDYVLSTLAHQNGAPLTDAEAAIALKHIGQGSRLERRNELFVERQPPAHPETRRIGRRLNIEDMSDRDYRAIMRIEQLLTADHERRLAADT